MPRETISVEIIRPGSGEVVRNGHGGYSGAEDAPITGSPFDARLFRAGDSGGGWERVEAQPGQTTLEKRRVLRLLDPVAAQAIQEGDIAIIPPCQGTGGKELRATIQHIRDYARSIQCDLETGDGRSEYQEGQEGN